MRPERLELAGFGAFLEPTVIDFGGVDLFALGGPTGAGKSTVLDAIAFALYGSVSRYDNPALVAPAVHARRGGRGAGLHHLRAAPRRRPRPRARTWPAPRRPARAGPAPG